MPRHFTPLFTLIAAEPFRAFRRCPIRCRLPLRRHASYFATTPLFAGMLIAILLPPRHLLRLPMADALPLSFRADAAARIALPPPIRRWRNAAVFACRIAARRRRHYSVFRFRHCRFSIFSFHAEPLMRAARRVLTLLTPRYPMRQAMPAPCHAMSMPPPRAVLAIAPCHARSEPPAIRRTP